MRANYMVAKLKAMAKLNENEPTSVDPVPTDWTTIKLILEDMIVTFLITLIPELILLGRPPQSILEIWVPLLSAVLMAIYSYMRMRGIERAKQEDE